MSEEYKGEEQRYEGDGPNVRLDDFVGRIVRDPTQPPELLLLSGYLGASSEEGHVRLYLDEELGRYVEIPEKAIRHTEELPPEQSPLGGSLVWIERESEVLHGKASDERRKATFLEGQIAQDYMGGAAAGGGGHDAAQGYDAGGAGLAAAATRGLYCTISGPRCWMTKEGPLCPNTSSGPNCFETFMGPLCSTRDFSCPTRMWCPVLKAEDPLGGGGGVEGGGGEGGGGGASAPKTQLLGCQSVANPCIPQTTFVTSCQSRIEVCITRTELPGCRTLTGIFCTRFGPGCRRTIFEPACTIAGPNCQTVYVRQCQSVQFPCVTHDIECQASGFVQCNPPTDFTLWQGGGPDVFAQQRVGGGGADPFGGGGGGLQTGFNCPSVFDNCATRESFCPSQVAICPTEPSICQTQPPICRTSANAPCPSINVRCPTESGPNCRSQMFACPPTDFGPPCQFETANNCPTFDVRCQTRTGPRCLRSRVAFCPDTRAGCQVQSVACGFDPAGGGGGGEQAFAAQQMGGGGGGNQPQETHFCIFTQTCTSNLATCMPRLCYGPVDPRGPINEARVGIQPSQVVRCPSLIDLCPTRYNCPSRFGCFETQFCAISQDCGVSRACFPGGGGGGFDPGRGGFGGGGF